MCFLFSCCVYVSENEKKKNLRKRKQTNFVPSKRKTIKFFKNTEQHLIFLLFKFFSTNTKKATKCFFF
jgi:hypothetical protein